MNDNDKDELIKNLRKKNEELEKAFADSIPELEKLKGITKMFENMPEIAQIAQSAEQLKTVGKQIEPFVKLISSLDPEKLKELMKKPK